MSNKIIIYFSASGTTKSVCEELAEKIGTETYEIVPKEKYTSGDLNWMNPFSRSSKEMKNKSSRPEIVSEEKDFSTYEKIYLAFPIWWGIAPTIVNTFLEAHDFSNKTIIPFATSGGSGYGKSNDYLKGSLSDSTTLKDGRIINHVTDEIIEELS